MIYNQTVGFCTVPETAVVVCAASGAILHSVHIIVVMHHFVQQSGTDFFDGAGKSTMPKLMMISVFVCPKGTRRGFRHLLKPRAKL